MSGAEDQPEKFWSIEESANIVAQAIQNNPELFVTLLGLTGGDSRLFPIILGKVADGYSFEPPLSLTPDDLMRFSGVPEDPTQLDAWRIALLEEQANQLNSQSLEMN